MWQFLRPTTLAAKFECRNKSVKPTKKNIFFILYEERGLQKYFEKTAAALGVT